MASAQNFLPPSQILNIYPHLPKMQAHSSTIATHVPTRLKMNAQALNDEQLGNELVLVDAIFLKARKCRSRYSGWYRYLILAQSCTSVKEIPSTCFGWYN